MWTTWALLSGVLGFGLPGNLFNLPHGDDFTGRLRQFFWLMSYGGHLLVFVWIKPDELALPANVQPQWSWRLVNRRLGHGHAFPADRTGGSLRLAAAGLHPQFAEEFLLGRVTQDRQARRPAVTPRTAEHHSGRSIRTLKMYAAVWAKHGECKIIDYRNLRRKPRDIGKGFLGLGSQVFIQKTKTQGLAMYFPSTARNADRLETKSSPNRADHRRKNAAAHHRFLSETDGRGTKSPAMHWTFRSR